MYLRDSLLSLVAFRRTQIARSLPSKIQHDFHKHKLGLQQPQIQCMLFYSCKIGCVAKPPDSILDYRLLICRMIAHCTVGNRLHSLRFSFVDGVCVLKRPRRVHVASLTEVQGQVCVTRTGESVELVMSILGPKVLEASFRALLLCWKEMIRPKPLTRRVQIASAVRNEN